MKKEKSVRKVKDDLRPEYDLSLLRKGVRGKYAKRFAAGTNVVLISPDLAKRFRDSASVNNALRKLIEFEQRSKRGSKAGAKMRTKKPK
jgi:hypothetical protein